MAGEMKITELIADIKQGEMILPEFQRGYVWTRDQVRSYLNSLYRGYPTGSFLIWKTPTPPRVRGGVVGEDTKSFRLILDGQQRLTTIFALMEGAPPPFYEGDKLSFPLYFNLVKEEFAYYKPSLMKGKPEWLPVTPFFQKGLAGFLTEISAMEQEGRDFYFAKDTMAKLAQLDQVRNYLYYHKDLTELGMDRVVEVFNLVNSAGTRLSKSDLALAHICSMWPEAREEFREAQARYSSKGFWFDLSFYTRCTAVVATGSAIYDPPLYRTPIEDIRGAWPKVQKALDYVLNVLRGDAYIDSAWTLPSSSVLVPLVAFLAAGSRASFDSDVQKRSLLHWMYAAMMWGRYSGSSESKLQSDIEALKSDDAPAKLRDNLILDRGRIRVEPKDLEGAGIRSPFYPMTYVVARSRGAVDWFNGVALYQKAIGQSMGLENHHIFPQGLLYKGPYDSTDASHKRMVNEIANIAFLTKQANLGISARDPQKYLPEVIDRYPDALRQQAVPHAAGLWDIARFEEFLDERRRMLAEAINTYMDSLLSATTPKGQTINDLIARGEGPELEFKSSIRWDHVTGAVNPILEKVVAQTVSGFMNHKGGTLVIGVTDEGSVAGVEADILSLRTKPTRDGIALHLAQILAKYLGAPAAALVDPTFATVDDKTVIVVSAEPATQPVFVEDAQTSEFYVRSGPSTRRLDVRETTDFIAGRWPKAA